MSPRISVIIPAFNAEKFIADAINSVLTQKHGSEIEIIVIDDRSSDNTKKIVSDLAAHNRQIRLLSNDRKKGPSGARNTGLLHARGYYVAFLDADDLWLNNHLEEGIAFLDKNNDIDIVFFNFEIQEYETKNNIGDWFSDRIFWKNLKTKEIENKYHIICDDIFNALLDESFIHVQSMIIRKNKTTGILFNENIKRSEDRDFCINLYLYSNAKFAFNNLVTGIYYRHLTSLTSIGIENTLLTALDHIYIFNNYLSIDSIDYLTTIKIKRMLLDRHISASYCFRKFNRYMLSFKHLIKSYMYGVSFSQHKEFPKILASFFIHNIIKIIKYSK